MYEAGPKPGPSMHTEGDSEQSTASQRRARSRASAKRQVPLDDPRASRAGLALDMSFDGHMLPKDMAKLAKQVPDVHTYIHTYTHKYIHTCNHTYIHRLIHIYIHTYIHACMHACIHTYIHTYTHTYMHLEYGHSPEVHEETRIHTCII